MTYLLILPEADQNKLAGHAILLVGHVYDYLAGCQSANCSPERKKLEDIRETYVNLGSEQAAELVKAFKSNFSQHKTAENMADKQALMDPAPNTSTEPVPSVSITKNLNEPGSE